MDLDIVHQYIYESDIYQRMMAGMDAAKIQRNEPVFMEDAEGIELEQNGLAMQGM